MFVSRTWVDNLTASVASLSDLDSNLAVKKKLTTTITSTMIAQAPSTRRMNSFLRGSSSSSSASAGSSDAEFDSTIARSLSNSWPAASEGMSSDNGSEVGPDEDLVAV